MAVSGTSSLLARRYRLHEPIAVGGIGEVWRADDEVLERTVAVKLLRSEYAGHAETLARFQAEARHASRLTHPGIVQVYDYGQNPDDGVPFLVMELIDGPSLAAVLAGGPQQPSWVLDVIGQVAAGLAAAHAEGLVHRDIKPANLLLAPGGMVKITDFGIASAAWSAPLTQDGAVACTPGYLAPERAAGSPARPASDVYSLGIVAWEAVTGEAPFTGTPIQVTLAHMNRDLPALPASVPGGLATLVTDLTARDPAARPSGFAVAARAGQLRAALAAGHPALAWQPPEQHPRPAATLAMPRVTADALPAEARMTGSGRSPGPIMATAAGLAATAVLAAVLIGAAGGSARQPAPTRTPAASAVTHARTVVIDNAALDGQPAALVLAALRKAGLRPSLVRVRDGGAQPGTVVSVTPGGAVPAHTSVTVTVAIPPPGHIRHHDNGAHRGRGNGGDKGD